MGKRSGDIGDCAAPSTPISTSMPAPSMSQMAAATTLLGVSPPLNHAQPYQIEVTLPSSPPLFDGSSNPLEYLLQFEEYYTEYGRKKGEKVDVFGTCMRGEARTWFQYQASCTPHIWDTLSQSFVERFGVASSQGELVQELHTFRLKKGESVPAYVERFHAYVLRCKKQGVETPTLHVVQFFILGLKPLHKVYRKMCKLQNTGALDSIQKAFFKAVEISKLIQSLPDEDHGPSHFYPDWEQEPDFVQPCYTIQKDKRVKFEDEIRAEVSKATDRLESGMQTLMEVSKQLAEVMKIQQQATQVSTCNFCKRYGHNEDNCYGRPCPKCMKRGHYGKECPICLFCKEVGHTERRCSVKEYMMKQEASRMGKKSDQTGGSASMCFLELQGEEKEDVLAVHTRSQHHGLSNRIPMDLSPVDKAAGPSTRSSPNELESLMKASKLTLDIYTLLKIAPTYREYLFKMFEHENLVQDTSTNLVIPQEEVDPGIFSSEATIGDSFLSNVILDGGSGLNVMPYHIMQQLGLHIDKRTSLILKNFTNGKVSPIGMVTKVPVN